MALIRFQIPLGWAVLYNNFEDILPEFEKNEFVNKHFFVEDILQIKRLQLLKTGKWQIPEFGLLIDLGWYPDSDINGQYRLELVEQNINDVWNVIDEFKSRNRFEVRHVLEIWLQKNSKNNFF